MLLIQPLIPPVVCVCRPLIKLIGWHFYLMPMKFEEFYRKGKYKKLLEFNLNSCIECGACEYICPSRVALIESIKSGKKELAKGKGDKN